MFITVLKYCNTCLVKLKHSSITYIHILQININSVSKILNLAAEECIWAEFGVSWLKLNNSRPFSICLTAQMGANMSSWRKGAACLFICWSGPWGWSELSELQFRKKTEVNLNISWKTLNKSTQRPQAPRGVKVWKEKKLVGDLLIIKCGMGRRRSSFRVDVMVKAQQSADACINTPLGERSINCQTVWGVTWESK